MNLQEIKQYRDSLSYPAPKLEWLIARIEYLDGLLERIEEHFHCDHGEFCITDIDENRYYTLPEIKAARTAHRCAASIAAERHKEKA